MEDGTKGFISMSAEQSRIIEAQQKEIKKLHAMLTEIVDAAQRNTIKAGVIQSGGTMKEVLDSKQPVSITRYGNVDAYVVPAHLLQGWAR